MALYKDGNPVSGLNSIPRLTLAQYNALNVKPEFWVRTDAPESYKKLSADQVSYDSNNTVKDKIDTLIKYVDVEITTTPNQYVTPYTHAGIVYTGIPKAKIISLIPMVSSSYVACFYYSDNTDEGNARIILSANNAGTYKVRVVYFDI